MHPDLEAALATSPFLLVREHPSLARAVRTAVERGELERHLPALYVSAGFEPTWRQRVEALRLACPDAVVCGLAAAKLTFWPELPDPALVEAAVWLRPRPGYAFSRRKVSRGHRRRLADGLWVTTRPMTALDLTETLGGDALDRALRSGATVGELRRAHREDRQRRGRAHRERLLDESRDNAWSPAERAAHRALHEGGIEGWVANLGVYLDGRKITLDIAFLALRLAIEIDGAGYHSDPAAFHRDRERDALLAAHGWQVVRFAAASALDDPAGFIARLRRILEQRRRLVGAAS